MSYLPCPGYSLARVLQGQSRPLIAHECLKTLRYAGGRSASHALLALHRRATARRTVCCGRVLRVQVRVQVRACVRTSTVACRLAAYSRTVARLPLHTARRCIRSLRLALSQWSARCMLHDGVHGAMLHDRRTHAASSCSTRFLSASACGRAATVKNVLKRSSTCASTQITNGLPPANAADSEQSARGRH
jgi:hypothetical protein